MDKELQTCSQNITKSGTQILQARKVQNNINLVIHQLKMYLPVLTTYSKLQKQISEKKYS